MKVKPLNGSLLVELLDISEVVKRQIIIPTKDIIGENIAMGRIVDNGGSVEFENGDVILFNKYDVDCELDNKNVLIRDFKVLKVKLSM